MTPIHYSIAFSPNNNFLLDTRTVTIHCIDTFFVVTDVGACPLASMMPRQAVYQPFEHGFMVWQPGKIWVFSKGTPSDNELSDT